MIESLVFFPPFFISLHWSSLLLFVFILLSFFFIFCISFSSSPHVLLSFLLSLFSSFLVFFIVLFILFLLLFFYPLLFHVFHSLLHFLSIFTFSFSFYSLPSCSRLILYSFCSCSHSCSCSSFHCHSLSACCGVIICNTFCAVLNAQLKGFTPKWDLLSQSSTELPFFTPSFF